MTLMPGEILSNRYRIVKPLARGSAGTLYRAWDTSLNIACAIKENLDDSDEIRAQFSKEAAVLASLNHPNLPRVTDFFALPGKGQYLVADFVEGDDLQDILDRSGGPLPLEQVLPWIGQVCDALDYLHSQSPEVIHQNIKPANIRITPKGQAKLVGFGIARAYEQDITASDSHKWVTSGFSPPEHYGYGSVDKSSDIYSLCATLFTLLTSQTPPDSNNLLSGIAAAPPLASDLNPQLPQEISQAIRRGMELSQTARFNTAGEVKQILLQSYTPVSVASTIAMASPSQPVLEETPPEKGYAKTAPEAPGKNRRVLYIVALVALVVLIAVCGVLGGQYAVRWYKNFSGTSPTKTEAAAVLHSATNTEQPIASDTPLPSPSVTFTVLPSLAATETNTPVPVLGVGSTMIAEIDNMVLVYVPEGEFEMGTAPSVVGSGINERPIHSVFLDAFWVDQTEVTVGMYTKCVEAGACTPPYKNSSATRSHYYDDQEYADFPVIYVTWEDADNYCQWAGRRLLTEAEWEYTARGTDSRLYPWGEELSCASANYWGYDYYDTWDDWVAVQKGCGSDTVKVGSYPSGASPFDVFDMVGNVAEWVADWYAQNYYADSPKENPTGPPSGTTRVIRGNMGYFLTYGVWVKYYGHRYNYSNFHFDVRPANRYFADPTYTRYDIGFRCASSP